MAKFNDDDEGLPKRKPPQVPPRPPAQGGMEARRPKPPPPPQEDDDEDEDEDRPRGKKRGRGALSSVIPYRNLGALLGYYCGFIALIAVLVGVILIKAFPQPGPNWFPLLGYGGGGLGALLAIGLGIWGLILVSQEPKAKGTGHALTAVVLGTVVLLALIVLVFLGGVGFLTRILQ